MLSKESEEAVIHWQAMNEWQAIGSLYPRLGMESRTAGVYFPVTCLSSSKKSLFLRLFRQTLLRQAFVRVSSDRQATLTPADRTHAPSDDASGQTSGDRGS